MAVALYNPEMFKTLGASRLDLGQVLNEKMTDQCYQELLVSPLHSLVSAVHHPCHACAQSPSQQEPWCSSTPELVAQLPGQHGLFLGLFGVPFYDKQQGGTNLGLGAKPLQLQPRKQCLDLDCAALCYILPRQ